MGIQRGTKKTGKRRRCSVIRLRANKVEFTPLSGTGERQKSGAKAANIASVFFRLFFANSGNSRVSTTLLYVAFHFLEILSSCQRGLHGLDLGGGRVGGPIPAQSRQGFGAGRFGGGGGEGVGHLILSPSKLEKEKVEEVLKETRI